MSSSLYGPRVAKNQQNVRFSYELPHRIHTAKSYPLQSINGSSIVIYGHENGARVVWRGGRPFKSSETGPPANSKTNGAGSDAVMILDSDDEAENSHSFVDQPEFEDEDKIKELESSQPHLEILQDLDLYLGTDVLGLALLPTPLLTADGQSWRDLDDLRKKIVFIAMCGDNVVRLVTLPLTPPSPTSKARPQFRSDYTSAYAGKGAWGETVTTLTGPQKPLDGVTMTVDFSSNTKTESGASGPQIIIVSHSRYATGFLQFYRVSASSLEQPVEPFDTIFLKHPAKTISFNPSLSNQRSSQLLVADTIGVCRIYDYRLAPKRPMSDDAAADILEKGTWLLSLFLGFHKQGESTAQMTNTPATYGRKTILDAQWASAGLAIIVLLSDGTWGVWDIASSGPGSSQGLLGRKSIKGGSLSEFSLTGFIEGANKPQTSLPLQAGSKFTPMTPGTRKTADFLGKKASSGPARGQISIIEIPSQSPTQPPEESVAFCLGDTYVLIPSLSKYWSASSRKPGPDNSFGNATAGRTIRLEGIDLQGERCSGIEQVLRTGSDTGLITDVIILGEHRFTILSLLKQVSKFQHPTRLALAETGTNANSGELDVFGIDQALANMEDGNRFAVTRRNV